MCLLDTHTCMATHEVQSGAVISCYNKLDIAYITSVIQAKYKSQFEHKKYTQ